jgi:hypothetical protein
MTMTAQTEDSPLGHAEEYLRRFAQLTGAKENYRLLFTDSGSGGGTSWWIRACHLTASQIDLLFAWDRPRCPQRRNSRVCAAPIEEQAKAV